MTPESLAPTAARPYRGRFAPSPTGPLHAGGLFCALLSCLDARAHEGTWLVRIEDIDPPREAPGAAAEILATLARFGLISDEPVIRQSDRGELYREAWLRLQREGRCYGCACSRAEIIGQALAQDSPAGRYPGTCRGGTGGRPIRSWRLLVPPGEISFHDRRRGTVREDVAATVGDFVIRRADGPWAYQLAVVVDDAAQGISDVVRGEDLLAVTPRQIVLQRALGLPTPRYAHIPLILDETGHKLSKGHGAAPLGGAEPLPTLEALWSRLALPRLGADSLTAFWRLAPRVWREALTGGWPT